MGRRNFQALHPFIHPSSREISKHHSEYSAGVWYHYILNAEKVLPEPLQDSHRKAQMTEQQKRKMEFGVIVHRLEDSKVDVR